MAYETKVEMMCAEPGMMPMKKPSTVPRRIGFAESRSSSRGRQQVAELRLQDLRRFGGPRGHQDLGDAEEPHGDGYDPDPVPQRHQPVREAKVPAHLVDADHPEHQAEHDHRQILHDRAAGHVAQDHEAAEQQAGVLRRAEAESEPGQRRREEHEPHHAEGSGDVGADRRDGQRGPGTRPSLLGHGVAVDAGHHRGRFPGMRIRMDVVDPPYMAP